MEVTPPTSIHLYNTNARMWWWIVLGPSQTIENVFCVVSISVRRATNTLNHNNLLTCVHYGKRIKPTKQKELIVVDCCYLCIFTYPRPQSEHQSEFSVPVQYAVFYLSFSRPNHYHSGEEENSCVFNVSHVCVCMVSSMASYRKR